MSRAYHAEDYKRLNDAFKEARRRLFAELEPSAGSKDEIAA